MYKKTLTTAIALMGLITTIFAQTTDVYVAGGEDGKVTVWKNGIPTYLTTPSDDDNWACGVYVLGNDVYVAGTESGRVVVWKNGIPNYLTDGTNYSEIFSMCGSGEDIYVAGYEENNDFNYTAKLWKNGTAINLTDGSSHAEANSVFVSGNDVYVAGYEQTDNSAGAVVTAKLWKIGEGVTDLTDGSKYGGASAVFVSGNDVYVAIEEHARNENDDATVIKLWKNGESFVLKTDLSRYIQISSMFVSGEDIYVSGYGFLILWRNGEVIDLTNDLADFDVRSVFVSGQDLHLAGTEYTSDASNAFYWKNGEKTILSNNGFATFVLVNQPNTGIPKIQNAEVKIYPNPTTGKVYIDVESNVKLYDSQGTLLQETVGKEIDLSAYPQGTYLLKIEGKTVKVIKQ